MPGLLGESSDTRAPIPDGGLSEHPGGLEVLRPAQPFGGAQDADERRDGSARMARLEDIVFRLEEERRQLSSEVAALRLVVEELREALVRVDERLSCWQPAVAVPLAPSPEPERRSFAPLMLASARPAGLSHGPSAGPSDPTNGRAADRTGEAIYAAGSVGVEVRLTAVDNPASVEELRRRLADLPEVETVRITSIPTNISEEDAVLRVYLRIPRSESDFLDMLGCAAPAAKPLAGPAPGTLLLRLRPS